MKATVTFTISFPIDVKQENRYYMASCPILDVWSYGETQRSAVDNLKETLQLFLAHCFDHGTLEMVLKGCGFTTEIDVPLPFVIDQSMVN